MFDINIKIDDISISSIEKEDIIYIQKWINNQQALNINIENPLGLKELYQRFLEYYVSESEFFLKLNRGENLIGVLKGRLEFKNNNEVWFWYYLIDHEFRGKGIGSNIVKEVMNYFSNNFGIYNFYTGVPAKDDDIKRFWLNNNFNLIRVSKNFFNINGEEIDMLILKAKAYM